MQRMPWVPPIITTTATENKGIKKLWKGIEEHRVYLEKSELKEKRLQKLTYELKNQLSQKLFTKKIIQVGEDEIKRTAEEVLERKIDPFTAIDAIIKE